MATLGPADGLEVLRLAERIVQRDLVAPLNEEDQLALRASIVQNGQVESATQTWHVLIDAVEGNDQHRTVVGYAQLRGLTTDSPSLAVLVAPEYRRQGHGTQLVTRAFADAAVHYGPIDQVGAWAHGDLPAAQDFARSLGARSVRTLHKMRRPTCPANATVPPLELPHGVLMRTFQPGHDEADWLALNARAFAGHPEQGTWTEHDLRARMVEPWFDPRGLLMAVDKDTGRLLGFHWTKVDGDIGEVYVIAVDPQAQGLGLGKALTLAGMLHLRDRGVEVIELYVDDSNQRARAVYADLGFVDEVTDVQYMITPDALTDSNPPRA